MANFYPRPPRGGRRIKQDGSWSSHSISIHALREEGDTYLLLTSTRPQNFYPRPPRGGRPGYPAFRPDAGGFLSTPSARRATRESALMPRQTVFLSTPSARRATLSPYGAAHEHQDFYPRPPRGGRHIIQDYVLEGKKFLSTPSARRATRACNFVLTDIKRFLSTPSARRATSGFS